MLTITDLFCGAGGSSQGAEAVPSVQLDHAANHWEVAVLRHQANFPHADHSVVNLSQINPRFFRRTDLLWVSPECTNHSQAKGIKRDNAQPDLFGETLSPDAAERSRATMWDVARFAEVHDYEAIVVENVVDAVAWRMWPAWLQAMTCLGYRHHVLYASSMHFPVVNTRRAPQSRDRIYVVFTKEGNAAPDLELRPAAYCARCDTVVRAMQVFKQPGKTWPAKRWGRYRAQYVYRCPNSGCRHAEVTPFAEPAISAIDLSRPGQRIGDRDRPLQPATLNRIRAGLLRYGVAQLVPAGGGWNEDTTPVTEPMRTRTTRETEGLLGLPAMPDGPVTATQQALITAYYGSEAKADRVDRPLRTVTATERFGLAIMPEVQRLMVMRNNGTRGARDGMMCTPATEPLRTITTTGHQSLVGWEPGPLDFARFETSSTGDVEDRGDLPPAIADCTFRMLEPDEIRAAMAFADGYRLEGNRRERIRQLGNAVTPPAAEWLVGRVAESLGYPPLEYDEPALAA
ncbi:MULTISPECIES: DNA cytosine methyltransferase [Saccharothrix]|uniref:DNA cytosine methyltransferase n=1 Tax=Saccharothrix TaxID=2071 RepID=UPI00093D295F|nr:DNA cytosine methyltransferase [Saccharothrix sp. CB00851]OKI35300.1 DNA methyltransferase [Saccharothrix sp. CB00851]